MPLPPVSLRYLLWHLNSYSFLLLFKYFPFIHWFLSSHLIRSRMPTAIIYNSVTFQISVLLKCGPRTHAYPQTVLLPIHDRKITRRKPKLRGGKFSLVVIIKWIQKRWDWEIPPDYARASESQISDLCGIKNVRWCLLIKGERVEIGNSGPQPWKQLTPESTINSAAFWQGYVSVRTLWARLLLKLAKVLVLDLGCLWAVHCRRCFPGTGFHLEIIWLSKEMSQKITEMGTVYYMKKIGIYWA